MRESIGGAWLFGVVIVFIFFFSAFLAYSISYTRAFKYKNEIIDMIEQNEGYTKYTGTDIRSETDEELNKTVEGRLYKIGRDMGYDLDSSSDISCEGTFADNNDGNKTTSGGFCLIKTCPLYPNGTSNTRYKIITYIAFKIPVVEYTIKIPIRGETTTIYTDNGGYPCLIEED